MATHDFLVSAIMPVGNYPERAENVNRIMNLVMTHDWLQVVIVFCGYQAIQEEQQFRRDHIGTIPTKRVMTTCMPRSGPGLGRNRGLSLASANLIVFWDDDDFPEVESLKKVAERQTHDSVIVGQYVTKNWSEPFFRGPSSTSSKCEISSDPGIWRMIFPARLIQDIRFSDSRIAEDHEFIGQLFSRDLNFFFVEETLYRYCRSANSLTSHVSISETHLVMNRLIDSLQESQVNLLPRSISTLAVLVSSSKLSIQRLSGTKLTLLFTPFFRSKIVFYVFLATIPYFFFWMKRSILFRRIGLS